MPGKPVGTEPQLSSFFDICSWKQDLAVWSGACYAAQGSLELTIFMHPKCWNYSSAPGLALLIGEPHGALRNSTFSVVMSRKPVRREAGRDEDPQLDAAHGQF